MRNAKLLSPTKVASIDKPGWHAVGDGAYLQISRDGTKSWLFRYKRNSKARAMGLGPFRLVTLAKAREKAREARKLLLEGIDPLDAKAATRRQEGIAAAKAVTFKDCAERYIKSHAASWHNPQAQSSVERDA